MTGLQLGVVTLFPEMFGALNAGVVGRGMATGAVSVSYWNPRDYCQDAHRRVDDRPYGGGPGMVMMPEPLGRCIHAAKQGMRVDKVVYLSPQGQPLTQAVLAAHTKTNVLLIAGRYEGIDQRVIDQEISEEWSIGDYVLSGGEFAAMVVIDGITRLLPGVLGHEESAQCDSFSDGLLDHPHFTRPERYNGQDVPVVLQSGHHEDIRHWRLKQALKQTLLKRPDLLATRVLSGEEKAALAEIENELKGVKHD